MEPGVGRPRVVGDLRALMRGLSRYRDLQVQQAMLAPLVPGFPVLDNCLSRLKSSEALAGTLLAGRLSSFPVEKLSAAVAGACRLLRRVAAGTRAEAGAAKKLGGYLARAHLRLLSFRSGVNPADPATVHRLRVAFKKYRYLAEPLAPLSGNPDPAALSRMHGLQGVMGDVQDLAVLLRHLRSWAASGGNRREAGPALRLLSGKLDQKTASFLSTARDLDSFVFPLRKDE